MAFSWFHFFLGAVQPESRIGVVGKALGEGYRELTDGLIFVAVQEGKIPWNDKMPDSWKPEEAQQ